MPTAEKFYLQDSQYKFPYHHLVSFFPFKNYAVMPWGLEYYAYITKVIERLQKMDFASLLDVGCGEGKMLLELRKYFPKKRLKGIDLSQRAILFAQAFNFGNGVEFIVEDINTVQDTFDCITLIETIEHIPDEEIPGFTQALFDRLSPKGALIVSVPTTNFSLQAKHYRHYNIDLLKAHFTQFTLRESYYLVRQGLLYSFFIRLSRKLCSFEFVQKLVILFARKTIFHATSSTGRHLVAIFEKNSL